MQRTNDPWSWRDPSRALYASIDRFSLIPSGPPGILDFPSLAAILSFTYSVIRDYLICIHDYIRYILYSTPLDPSIFIVVLTRLCVDYRRLNSMRIKNPYHLPLIHEILNRLSGARVLTKIDVINAYYRLRIREGDEWQTAFQTR